MWTYAIPFLITVLTDLAVLIFSERNSRKFTPVIKQSTTINTSERAIKKGWRDKKAKNIVDSTSSASNPVASPPTQPILFDNNHFSMGIKIQSKDSVNLFFHRIPQQNCIIFFIAPGWT